MTQLATGRTIDLMEHLPQGKGSDTQSHIFGG